MDYTLETIEHFIGQELGVSDWLLIDQERIDLFAKATSDYQWIHVDVDRCKRESPYGKTIAHGYLTLSLIASEALAVRLAPKGTQAAINYGTDKVRFLNPVVVDSRIRNRVSLIDAQDKANGKLIKLSVTTEIENWEKPAMIAETLVLLL